MPSTNPPKLEDFLWLADHIAGVFWERVKSSARCEYDDLQQEAHIALWTAIKRFDPRRGIKFASYADPRIRGLLRHYLRDRTRVIRIPGWNFDQKTPESKEADCGLFCETEENKKAIAF